jgi:hypothetical protein
LNFRLHESANLGFDFVNAIRLRFWVGTPRVRV